MMKRVFVTGATGYIGSNLVRRLSADHQVHILVRNPVNTEYIEDIMNCLTLHEYDGTYESVASAIKNSCPEAVYHLAAYYTGSHGPDTTPSLLSSNITLGGYLLEAMVQSGCRKLVYAATVMEHYMDRAYKPLNLYAATKRAFSDLLEYYADAGELDAAALVIADTYGPGDHRPKVLNMIRQAIMDNSELALSDGRQDYDLVYIDDVVKAFAMAGEWVGKEGAGNNRFQVMADEPVSLRETAECMAKVNGLDTGCLMWGARTSSNREIRKAVRLYPPIPGWKNEVTLEEGLKRLWEDD